PIGRGSNMLFMLAGVIIAGIFLADVLPALKRVMGRAQGNRWCVDGPRAPLRLLLGRSVGRSSGTPRASRGPTPFVSPRTHARRRMGPGTHKTSPPPRSGQEQRGRDESSAAGQEQRGAPRRPARLRTAKDPGAMGLRGPSRAGAGSALSASGGRSGLVGAGRAEVLAGL